MRAVVQRVSDARVLVSGEIVGAIGPWLLIVLGVAPSDTVATARQLAERLARLRVFPGAEGRMDRSLLDRGGGALVVSQFTLFADCRRGHRPSFTAAAAPELAQPLCATFGLALETLGIDPVAQGAFGAHMVVEARGDGPVTVVVSVGDGGWDTAC